MRILAIDPGDRRIGVAISDSTGTIARALTSLKHVSRPVDAAAIAALARDHEAGLILVGSAGDLDSGAGVQARKSARLAEAIRAQIDLPIELWDEALTTQDAHRAIVAGGGRHRNRVSVDDAVAAAVLLQSFLDAHPPSGSHKGDPKH